MWTATSRIPARCQAAYCGMSSLLGVSAPAAGAAAVSLQRPGALSLLAARFSTFDSGPAEGLPGQAFLDSLINYEQGGIPRGAGVAPPSGAAAEATPSPVGQGHNSNAGAPSRKDPPATGFDLSVMRQLLTAMGNPQQKLPVVHIAGTKGKGSVAAMISEVLRAAGYRVGTYTSPHMFSIRERIVVGGASCDATSAAADGHGAQPISEAAFEALAVRAAQAVAAMQHVLPSEQHLQQQQQPPAADDSSSSTGSRVATLPSYFEATTAMALQHFVDESVDIAVVETGLGGATDATNVFDPHQLQLAVLTSVGMDHVDALGGSLESIARAKAGIMKPGVPVVVGAQGLHNCDDSSGASSSADSHSSQAVLRIFKEAASAPDMKCPLLLAEELVQVDNTTGSTTGSAAGSTAGSTTGSTAGSAAGSTKAGGTVSLLSGPGSHLARQALHVASRASSQSTAAAAGDVCDVSSSQTSAATTTTTTTFTHDQLTGLWDLQLPSISLQLVGDHQASNVQTAVAAIMMLAARGWERITPQAVQQGLEAAWLPGRCQVAQLPESSTHHVLDGAHTADSAAALASTLGQMFPSEPVVLVVAMAADKQHRDVLQALRAIRPRVVIFTSVPIAGSHARSAPPGTLAAHWQAAAMLSTGKTFRCRELIQAGLGAALEKARHELGAFGGKGVVVVTGSLHAVAAAMKQLELA